LKGRLAARRRQEATDRTRHTRGALEQDELRALQPDRVVDALGTFCPEPVIRTQKQAGEMGAGEVLELLADDAGVEIDIPAWCLSTRNEYLGSIREPNQYRVFVRLSRTGR